MAKKSKVETRTINGDDSCGILEHSKDTVWVYNAGSKSLKFIYQTAKDPQYDTIDYGEAFIRQGNDLVFITLYKHKTTHAVKKITNTIKNYYLADHEITVTRQYGINLATVDDLFYTSASGWIWDLSNSDTNQIYGSKKKDSYNFVQARNSFVIDEAGNDSYDVKYAGSGNSYYFDLKGNDKYNFVNARNNDFPDIVNDYAGNDKYKVSNKAKVSVTDYKGKDSYEVYDESLARINDYNGNDKYTMNNVARGSSVSDYAGNDSYSVSNILIDNNFMNIYDTKGNDKYKFDTITSSSNKNVEDKSGKDTYNISGVKSIIIKDNSDYDKKRTDDTYNVTNSSIVIIEEKSSTEGKKIASGNDKYNFNGVENTITTNAIKDSAGNDKYNIQNSATIKFEDEKGADSWNLISSKNMTVTDKDGKDKWNIVSSAGGEGYKLTDNKGDDVWTFNNSKSIYAVDKEGADKYTISNNSIGIDITDNAGNDKYTIKDSIDLAIDDKDKSNDKYDINNYTSTDKYNILFVDDGGKDSYNINNSSNFLIENMSGNTTYTVNNSRTLSIGDNAETKAADSVREKNTFNIKNSFATNIDVNYINYEEGEIAEYFISNDTYNVTASEKTSIYDQDLGNDTYNIKSNQGGTIMYDDGGNDSYTIDKLTNDFKIADGSGTDTLSLSKTKADNLIYMANYNTSTHTDAPKNDVKDGSLFIFDKSTKGYIEIKRYFKTKTDSFGRKFLNGDGYGIIETINAGKKDVTSAINTYAESISDSPKYDALGEAVAGWLNTNSYSTDTYSSIGTILDSDKANDFLAFVSQYKPAS